MRCGRRRWGTSFSEERGMAARFEKAFPTRRPKSAEGYRQIKDDMESAHPMDRLLCGDVGLRQDRGGSSRGFQASLDGKQVMVLVPTTILASSTTGRSGSVWESRLRWR